MFVRYRETVLVVGVAGLLAGAMNLKSLRHPATSVPQDLTDPMYFVWQLAWLGRAVREADLTPFTTNAFGGADGTLAFTDVMYGYLPLASLASGLSGALVVYHVIFVLTFVLNFGGAYALARVLGAPWAGALVAGAAFTYAPWRTSHQLHLNVLSTGGIPLALALLALGHAWTLGHAGTRGHAGTPGGVGPRRPRPGLVVAGWLVAGWQLSLGLATGIYFALLLGAVYAVAGAVWLGRRSGRRASAAPVPGAGRRVLAADAAGGLVFAVLAAAMARPLLDVAARYPTARRTEQSLDYHSPYPVGLITSPRENRWWGGLTQPFRDHMFSPIEQSVFVGLVLLLLALGGLARSRWSRAARAGLGAAAVVGAVLALGNHGPFGGRLGYLLLFEYVPGMDGLRTPGRLILFTTLALALLAAGFVGYLADAVGSSAAWPRRRAAVLAALLALPAAAVTLEGAGAVAQPVVPRPGVDAAGLAQPVMFLPSTRPADYLAMAWSVDGWPTIANGASGFDPPEQERLRRDVAGFPDAGSVAALRARGVRSVVVTREPGEVAGLLDPRPRPGLTLVAEHGRTLVYALSGN